VRTSAGVCPACPDYVKASQPTINMNTAKA